MITDVLVFTFLAIVCWRISRSAGRGIRNWLRRRKATCYDLGGTKVWIRNHDELKKKLKEFRGTSTSHFHVGGDGFVPSNPVDECKMITFIGGAVSGTVPVPREILPDSGAGFCWLEITDSHDVKHLARYYIENDIAIAVNQDGGAS